MFAEYIASLFEPNALYAPWDDFWYGGKTAGGNTMSGPVAGPDTAMHVAAFFNGVRILAETVAQPPLILYERTSEDTKEKAQNNPLFTLLHDQPNQFQSSYEYRLLLTTNMLLGGNAYSEIVSGSRGPIGELRPLMTGYMTPKKLASGRLGYMYRDEKGNETVYTQDEIFHVRAFPLSADGVTGQSLLTFARETLGLALATQNYGTRLYNTDAKQRGNYAIPGSLTKEQIDTIKDQIRQSDGLMVLTNGATWVQTGMTAQDAEFLLNRKFEIVEICRWLNVQPHLLKDLDRSTNNNIEHQGLEFLQFTMMPYFINWEQSILRDLIVQKSRFFAEFLVDGLVRADIATRYSAYGTGINTGFMSRNQVRIKENWNSEPGLDQFLVDQNKALVDKKGNIIPVNKPDTPQPAVSPNNAAHYHQLLLSSCRRVMHAEAKELERAWKKDKNVQKLADWAEKFYAKHAEFAAEVMQIDEKKARKFAEDRRDQFLLSVKDNSFYDHVHQTEKYGSDQLIAFLGNGTNHG